MEEKKTYTVDAELIEKMKDVLFDAIILNHREITLANLDDATYIYNSCLDILNGRAGGQNGGTERTVEVYDATGNLLKTYRGKFDIDYDDSRIIFDDEENRRHVIYYPTGTVIVDEVKGQA